MAIRNGPFGFAQDKRDTFAPLSAGTFAPLPSAWRGTSSVTTQSGPFGPANSFGAQTTRFASLGFAPFDWAPGRQGRPFDVAQGRLVKMGLAWFLELGHGVS